MKISARNLYFMFLFFKREPFLPFIESSHKRYQERKIKGNRNTNIFLYPNASMFTDIDQIGVKSQRIE